MISSTEPHVQTVSNDGNFWQNKSNEKNKKKPYEFFENQWKKKTDATLADIPNVYRRKCGEFLFEAEKKLSN